MNQINFRLYFNQLVFLFVCLSTIFYFVTNLPPNFDPVQYAYNIQEFFVKFGMLFIFAVSLFFKPLREGNFKVFALFLAYLFFAASIRGFDVDARRTILNVGISLVFYKAVTEHLDLKHIKGFAWWIIGLILLNAVWMILQGYNIDPLFTRVNDASHINYVTIPERAVGFLKLKANVGVFGGIAGVVLALIHPALAVIAVPFLIMGQTSSSIAAFIVSMLTLLFFRVKKFVFLGICAVLILSGAFYIKKYDMPNGQFSERFKVWHAATSVVLKVNPILGVGAGRFSRVNFQTSQVNRPDFLQWGWAHNEYMQVFFENGIIGILIVGLFMFRQVNDFLMFREDRDIQVLFSCFLCVALISFIQFPFHVGKFSALCVFIMALFHARVSECRLLRL